MVKALADVAWGRVFMICWVALVTYPVLLLGVIPLYLAMYVRDHLDDHMYKDKTCDKDLGSVISDR